MLEKRPFHTIAKAKEHLAAARQSEAVPGALNPAGQRGQVVEDMLSILESADETELLDSEPIRKLFKARIGRHIIETYNKFLVGKKGSPTHHVFVEEVESAMKHAFSLYLTAFYRKDMSQAPQPFTKVSQVIDSGKRRTIREADDLNHEGYERKYLTEGRDISFANGDDADHQFDRNKAFEGYIRSYQASYDDPERSALAAYAFEKLRIFETEFFANLNTALSEQIPMKRALEFAHYCYGLRAGLVAEMTQFGLSPLETVKYGIQNRTSAEYAFSVYKRIGHDLEENYKPESKTGVKHSWIRTDRMMRNYVFKYPETIEKGVKVVDAELSSFMKDYPQIPKRILIELCLQQPDTPGEAIETFLGKFENAISQFPVPLQWVLGQSDMNVFSYYRVEAEAMLAFHRANGSSVRPLKDALNDASVVHAKLQALASADGIPVSTAVTRQVLRKHLLRNISRSKSFDELKKYYERDKDHEEEVYKVAESKFSEEGEDVIRCIVELGYGNSTSERLETGQSLVQLMSEGKNESEAHLHMDDCIELYYNYIDHGFPQDPKSLNSLKDAISMEPNNPRKFFEEVLQLDWPKDVPVLKSHLEDSD